MSPSTTSSINYNTSFDALRPVALRWLAWQCKMISEIKIGTVFLKNENNDEVTMVASWPDENFGGVEHKLHDIAVSIVDGKKARSSKLTCHLNNDETVCDTITLPLHHKNQVIGTVIFLQSVRSEEQKKAVFQLFQWGSSWLEATLSATLEESGHTNSITNSLIKTALQDEPSEMIGYQLCNALAEYFKCTRVALGEVNGLQVRTLGLSNQLRFDHSASHVRDTEMAMEESLDQKKTILYPKSEEMISLVTQKHKIVSELNDGSNILTIPLANETDILGVMSFVRPKNRSFSAEDLRALHSALDVLGVALAVKFREEHSFVKGFFDGVKKKLQPIFGAGHYRPKMIMAGALVLLATWSFFKTPYTISAKSSLEGAIEHVIVSPYDGFIKSADVRAGEKVDVDQVLVKLDDYDLKLEESKLLSQRAKIKKEYREALALRERVKVSVLSAQISQVDANLNLVKEKLKRSSIKSPFLGVVVSGDLSQSLGAPVEKGEALFKVSPLGDYRVVLNVENENISKLKIGEEGSLRLMGLPYDELSIIVSRIIPIATAKDGGNFFRVEAKLVDSNETKLKPGMQGIAKVEVGEDNLLWVLSHTFFERIGLWLWSLGV